MSGGVVEDITEVLELHGFRITGQSDQPMCCECQEGCSDSDGWMLTMEPQDHPAHVAAAVQAALELTEEFTWSWPAELTGTGEPGFGYPVGSHAEAVAEADPYMTIVSRFVTPWLPSQSGDTTP